jgi:hypothetical protein
MTRSLGERLGGRLLGGEFGKDYASCASSLGRRHQNTIEAGPVSVVTASLVDPREATELAKHTGTTVAMVH